MAILCDHEGLSHCHGPQNKEQGLFELHQEDRLIVTFLMQRLISASLRVSCPSLDMRVEVV